MTADVLRLKVTLDHVEPKVLRRIEVPADIKLDRLHLTLQAALGWTNSHLYEIRARDIGWGLPSPDRPDGPLDARKAKLIDMLEDAGTKTLRYLYDFGDGWEHTIKIERMAGPDPDVAYPRLIEASGRCPPEDVGGPSGYAEMLEALAVHRTGRLIARAANATTMSSGYRPVFMPKPPPTSSTTTRTWLGGIPSTSLQSVSRAADGKPASLIMLGDYVDRGRWTTPGGSPRCRGMPNVFAKAASFCTSSICLRPSAVSLCAFSHS